MASIHLQGILVDSLGDIDVGAIMTFTHLTNTGETIASTKVDLIIPPDGVYSIDVEYGQIRVDYTTEFTERFVAIVVVNQDSTATSIPELLNAAVPVTDPVILEMQDILADAVAAADTAEAFADQITTFDLIGSTATFAPDTKITTKGYLASGDGGKGSWIQNGVTAQTPSQTPAQLLNGLLNDGNGNQWELDLYEDITVKSLGAVGDGVADDTLPIQAAINYQDQVAVSFLNTSIGATVSSRAMPYVDYGKNKYSVTAPISVYTYIYMKGDQALIVNDIAGGIEPVFRMTDGDWGNNAGWVGVVKDIQIAGNAFKLNTRPLVGDSLNEGKITFNGVTFTNADIALEYDLQSSSVLFTRCKWDNCVQHIRQYACDLLKIEGCWISPRTDSISDYESFFNLVGLQAVVEDSVFVPAVQNGGGQVFEYSWFGNKTLTNGQGNPREGLTSFYSSGNRYGGEPGSCPIINWYRPIEFVGVQPTQINIKDNYTQSALGGAAISTSVNLFALPNSIVVDDNSGALTQGYLVAISSTIVDFPAFFENLRLATISSRGAYWVDYRLKGNATTTNFNYDNVAPQLRGLFHSDLQREIRLPNTDGASDTPLNPVTVFDAGGGDMIAFKYNVNMWSVNIDDTVTVNGKTAFHSARVNFTTNPGTRAANRMNQEFLVDIYCDYIGGTGDFFEGAVTETLGRTPSNGTKLSITNIFLEYSDGTIIEQELVADISATARLLYIILVTDKADGFTLGLNSFSAKML